jgi:hypothetical protein
MYRAGPRFAVALLFCALRMLHAQELSPRAYLITPIHSNAINLTWSFYDGSIDFNGALPSSNATGRYNIGIVSYYHSFGVFGRSANVVASLPYAVGNFEGTAFGVENHLYRSGLTDSIYRVAVNLKGGPAMQPRDFVKWNQKVLIGASLKVIAPTGQYDPTKLIGWGANRWGFKPELGYSQRLGKWMLDAYGGVWFFTTNTDYWSRNIYFAGTRSQSQDPVGAVETHLSYNLTRRLWVSLDGNYWFGGSTSVAGVPNPLTSQRNSRIGATAAIPITRHQSLKFGYSDGAHIEFGGNYKNTSVSWQYSWLGRPK